MSVLYFIPNVNGVTKKSLASMGLGIFEETGLTSRQTYSGPDGIPGVVVGAGEIADIGYYPARQVWHKLEKYWFGIEGEARPVDFERKKVIGNKTVCLLDGNEWVIPVIRSYRGETMLDRKMVLMPEGGWGLEVIEIQKPLYESIDKIWEHVMGSDGESVSLEYSFIADLTCEILALNYHITKEIVSILGLLSTATVDDVVRVITDMEGFTKLLEELKKNKEL